MPTRSLRGERRGWAAPTSGDADAIKSVLAIMARRARLFGLDMPAKVDVAEISSIELAEEFVRLVSVLDPQGLAEAISHLPGGSSAAVQVSRNVLHARAYSRMSGGHPVVDSNAEPLQDSSMDAGDQNGDDDDDEPWSNL